MSRYRDYRPHEPFSPRSSRRRSGGVTEREAVLSRAQAPDPVENSAPSKPNDPLGPRPVSARQRAHREGIGAYPQPIPPAAQRRLQPPSPPAPPARTGKSGARRPSATHGATMRHVRDSDASQVRVRPNAKKRNRRRRVVNWPKALLFWSSVFLAAECAAALMFSPRLWVRRVLISGNQAVPAQSIIGRLHLGEHDNIVRLSTKRLRAAVLQEPQIETATVHRRLPSTIEVDVTERQPWACVQIPSGACFVVDAKFVPFRAVDVPPVGLPLLKLSDLAQPPILGKPIVSPGLDQVSLCLNWAKTQPAFRLDSMTVDGEGRLTLNRAGGTTVQLGSARNLDKKLGTLTTLLNVRPELRDQATVNYINLVSYVAPAVAMRAPQKNKTSHSPDADDSGSMEAQPSPAPSITPGSPADANPDVLSPPVPETVSSPLVRVSARAASPLPPAPSPINGGRGARGNNSGSEPSGDNGDPDPAPNRNGGAQ